MNATDPQSRAQERGPRLRTRLLMASFLLFVAITVAMAVMGHSLDELTETNRRTTQTTRLLAVSAALQKSFIDIETGHRGFAITRQERYLEPWEAGRRDVERYGRQLAGLARTPEDRATVAEINRRIDEYVTEYSEPLVVAVRRGETLQQVGARLPNGKERVDAIRALFEQLQAPRAAAVVREDREARATAADARTLARILWLGLAFLLVAVAVYVARSVARPLARVRAGVAQVAAGDYDVHVDGGTLPETAELAAAFNEMAVQLRESSERMEAQRAEIERHAAALERSNADLEQFAYAAAHDLQEPLRTVASYTELLARRYRGRLDDDADDFIQFAVDGATRMQTLIRDLLAYSRLNTRAEDPHPVALDAVLANVERSLAASIDEAGATVEHDGLPVVLGDATQLELLLQNLVGNAIKFRGERPPVVRVEHEGLEDGRVEVRVVDNGIGIEPEYRERVFRLFQRLNHRAIYDGTGIGLALCKRVVERHGGTIRIEAVEGGGTAFAFDLPVAPDAADAATDLALPSLPTPTPARSTTR